MYLNFYGLKEKPFNVTADPNFLFLTKKPEEALHQMLYGIQHRMGFIEITGEIGTGKTTLCKALINLLGNTTKTSFVIHPNLSDIQLLQAVVEDFGIKTRASSRLSMLKDLYAFLIATFQEHANACLIIDEAQNLKPRQLEQIRLISNLETEKEKLIQIVLVGQPQLRELLREKPLEQIRQRIAIRYHIKPLDQGEIAQYIAHRLSVAGDEGKIAFNEKAVEKIYLHSQGVPRLVNILCDRCLLMGFVRETTRIEEEFVETAAQEIETQVLL